MHGNNPNAPWCRAHRVALTLTLTLGAGGCDDGSSGGAMTETVQGSGTAQDESGTGAETSGGDSDTTASVSGTAGASQPGNGSTTEGSTSSNADSSGSSETESGSPSVDCVSEVPCASDTHCIAMPGFGCNVELEPPRCQQIQCGADGAACQNNAFCDAEHTCVEQTCTPRVDAEAACVKDCIGLPQRFNIEFGDDHCDGVQVVEACFAACEGYPDVGWWDDECQGREVDFAGSQIRCTDTAVCELSIHCNGSAHTVEGSDAC